jgi:hypothetical protein
MVADHVADPDLPSLLRVNSEWYIAAIPHLFRKVRLDEYMCIVGPGYELVDADALCAGAHSNSNTSAKAGPGDTDAPKVDTPNNPSASSATVYLPQAASAGSSQSATPLVTDALADAASPKNAHSPSRPLFRTSWLQKTRTLEVAVHDHAECEGSAELFPNIDVLRCPLAMHSERTSCPLSSLTPRTLVHRATSYDGPLTTLPATPPPDTYVLEFDPLVTNTVHLVAWLILNRPRALRTVAVIPVVSFPPLPNEQANMLVASSMSLYKLWSRDDDTTLMVVGGPTDTRSYNAPVMLRGVPTPAGAEVTDMRSALPRLLALFLWMDAKIDNPNADARSIDTTALSAMRRVQFRSLDGVLESGELDDIYSHEELKLVVLGEAADSEGDEDDTSA